MPMGQQFGPTDQGTSTSLFNLSGLFFRFNGMFMVIPTVGITVLMVVILMVITRIWMIGAPKYTRKHVRFPNRFEYPNPDDKLQAKPRHVYFLMVFFKVSNYKFISYVFVRLFLKGNIDQHKVY